jgi:hypothetical protein
MREALRFRVDGYEAYARVLLDWYTHGKFWIEISEHDVSVESLLLDALKMVADADLRQRIEEALTAHQRSVYIKNQHEQPEEQFTLRSSALKARVRRRFKD